MEVNLKKLGKMAYGLDLKIEVDLKVNTIMNYKNNIQSKKYRILIDYGIYEGMKSIKAVFYEMYDYIGKNGEYSVFPIGEQLGKEKLIIFWTQVLGKAEEMRIKIKTLPNKKLKKIFEEHYKKYKFIKIKYTSQEFPAGIFIFKDHVLNVNLGDKPIATLIRSRENYLRWKKFFNEQWKRE